MNVYMVLAQLGNGGKGGAVIGRASMFARAGHQVTIAVLNFQPSFNKNLERYRLAGRLHPEVEIINLFDALSAAIDSPMPRSIFRWIREGRQGSKDSEVEVKIEIDENSVIGRDKDGRTVRVRHYDEGLITADQYFASSGRLYVQRVYKGGRSAAVDAYDPSTRMLKRYRGYWRWQAEWLAAFVKTDGSPPVILCDSQAKMAPILTHLKPEVATRVGILHANHFDEPPYVLGSEVKPNDSRFLRRLGELDALVTLTQAQANDIAEEFGNADRIHVIPNVVNEVPVLESNEHDKRVTIFSRLTAGKRIADAIQAFAKVIEDVPGATLDIYGQGRDRGKLQKVIDENKLTGVVKLRGFTSQARSEMAASAVTLLPTDTEGLPLTIVESLLSGTPVISYDVNYGPSELIDDGVDGILVPHADVDALASAIIELLNDPERAKRMGAQGREKALKKYSEEVVMTQWDRLLSDLGHS